MNTQSKQSLKKSFDNGQGKSKKRTTQLQTIFEYLQNHVATASMVTDATGIPQKCITRYKRGLEKVGKLKEVKKTYCKITGFRAWYLTSNPDFFTTSNQTKLF